MSPNDWFKKEKPLTGLLGMGGGGNVTPVYVPTSDPVDSSGGTKSTPGDGYNYHLFEGPGDLTITATGTIDPTAGFEVVIIGGGGGGGFDRGGGGGAGAFRPVEFPIVAATMPLTVGGGGGGNSGDSPTRGGPGTNSTFAHPTGTKTANGGGGGGGTGHPNNNQPGSDSPGNGSGGGTEGSEWNSPTVQAGNGGAYGTPGFYREPAFYVGGGGGGGGQGGGGPTGVANPVSDSTWLPTPSPGPYMQCNGGNGATKPWFLPTWGVSGYFAGGGGGGGGIGQPVEYGNGGPGGGAVGGGPGGPNGNAGGDANPWTGGGGGGGGGASPAVGGAGAAGAVVARVPIAAAPNPS